VNEVYKILKTFNNFVLCFTALWILVFWL